MTRKSWRIYSTARKRGCTGIVPIEAKGTPSKSRHLRKRLYPTQGTAESPADKIRKITQQKQIPNTCSSRTRVSCHQTAILLYQGTLQRPGQKRQSFVCLLCVGKPGVDEEAVITGVVRPSGPKEHEECSLV